MSTPAGNNRIEVDLELKCEHLRNQVIQLSDQAAENWAAAQQMFRENQALKHEMTRLEEDNKTLVQKVSLLDEAVFQGQVAALDPEMTMVPPALPTPLED